MNREEKFARIKAKNARIILYWDFDNFEDVEEAFYMDDNERTVALENFTESKRVYFDLNGHIRDGETIRKGDYDEFREVNWERDFQC